MRGDANTPDIRPSVALIDEFTIHFFTDAALCAKNRQYETVDIDGKQEKIYVPFAMLTGVLLDGMTTYLRMWTLPTAS